MMNNEPKKSSEGGILASVMLFCVTVLIIIVISGFFKVKVANIEANVELERIKVEQMDK